MGVIFYVLELSIINALVVFRQTGHADITHRDFREQLWNQLRARAEATVLRQAAEAAAPVPAALQQSHLIRKMTSQRRCAECYRQGKKDSKTSYECTACNTPLHADCFFPFHENLID